MPWYQAIVTPDGAVGTAGTTKPLFFFDGRSLAELQRDLVAHGYVEVERASTERRIESRGAMILRDPHVMALQRRPELDFKAPDGPALFVMRDNSKKQKPPIEQ